MVLNSSTKKIIVYILLFPPIALLLYAIASYFIFFNFKYDVQNNIDQIENRYIPKVNKDRLLYKMSLVKKLVENDEDLDSFLKNDVKCISRPFGVEIALLKNGKIIFPPNANKELQNLLKNVKNNTFYENKDYLAYASSIKNFKILTYYDKSAISQKSKEIKERINSVARKSFYQSLFFLVVIWFFIVAFSALLAYWVYKVLKKYENSLEESNRNIIFQSRQALLGELLPMIAHQWRQPLNKIAAVLMRMRFELMKGEPDVATLDRQCQTIENSVELMSNTIDDFRTFYRPKESPEPADLSIIVRKAIYFLDEFLEKKKINITTNLEPTVVKIHSNEFLQVVINLVKNAADAVDENGHIEISLREREDGVVEFRIEDDGPGIPQNKLEKIFEPHESTKQGSMGLGLYMSRLIVESHFKGKIQAYNTSKGAGFIIVIPVKK
jgi:signal transduction histidine kinase